MTENETVIFSNLFGTTTNKRVILNYKSGTEDLPISKITSISYQHKRNYFQAIGAFALLLLGLVALLNNIQNLGTVEVLIFVSILIFLLLTGVANWIGHHNIIISVGGNNRRPIKAEMSKTKEGREFADSIRRVIQ